MNMRNKIAVIGLALLSVGMASGQTRIVAGDNLSCFAVPSTGTSWTTSTTVNTTQVLATNVAGSQVLVTVDQGANITGGALQFQVDPGDGTIVNAQAWQVLDPTSSTGGQISMPYTMQASTNKQFLILMGGAYRLQLKLTTAITTSSGTGSSTPFTIQNCYSTPQRTFLVNSTMPALGTGANTIGAVTQASGPWTNNVTQWASGALGSPSNYGTSPGAVAVPGVNAFITNTPAVSQSGSWSLASNQSVNLSQMGGTAVVADPCQAIAKSFSVISLTANTQVITGTASKKTYVCAINVVAGAATNVALVEGTGTVCATGIAGMAGGSTAATGWNFAANGGLTLGSGEASVMVTATTADNVCLLVSAANQVSGTIAYVQQ